MRISTLFSIATDMDKVAATLLVTEFLSAAEAADEVLGIGIQQVGADCGMIEVVFEDGTTREVAESFVRVVIDTFTSKSGIESLPTDFIPASETSLAEGLAFLAAQRKQAQQGPVDRSMMN
jgi:hypothetical protein